MVTKTISVEKWKKLKREIFGNSITILESVEVLIENINQSVSATLVPIVCAGLFSHAIEEYGKLLYLKSLIPNGDKVEIDYDKKFKNHPYKFAFALDVLPERCVLIHKGGFSSNFSSDFDIDTVADWETRLNIFNTDFDDDGNVVSFPSIDIHNLKKAVTEFRKALNSTILD